MNRQRFLPLALGVLTLARLALLPLAELSPVEAHAALCSQRLELWHPMTGPLLPLLVRISTSVLGLNEFGVRFFAPILMLGTGWLVWKVARGLFDNTIAAWAAVLFQVTPVVNVASVTFTNTTLGIAESAALLALLRLALHRPRRFHLHWWAVAGMTSLAFFTDWRLVVFTLAGTGSLVLTRRGRLALLKWPVLPILCGALAFGLLLFLLWNFRHDWTAFHFPAAAPSALGTIWHSGLLAYALPMILLLGWALVDATLQRPITYAPAFLLAFAWPLISLDILSLHSAPWPQVGFAAWLPPVVMLAAARLMQTERIAMPAKVWIRSIVILASSVQSCFVLEPSVTRAFGLNWRFDPPRHEGFLPGNPSRDFTGWRIAAEQIRGALALGRIDPARCFLVAARWDLAESLAFHLQGLAPLRPTSSHPLVHVPPDDAGSVPFRSWPPFHSGSDAAAFRKATAVFITDDAHGLPPEPIAANWPRSKVIALFVLKRNDQPLRTLKVFACSPAPTAEKSEGEE